MKIHKGDTVLIISGKDRAKKGKILQVFPKENKIVVEGANLRKKHQGPKKTGEKGQIVEIPASFDVSKVKLLCPKCKKATRIGYQIISKISSKAGDFFDKGEQIKKDPSGRSLRLQKKSKIRVCKKCGQEI